jgi:hypothetical protein
MKLDEDFYDTTVDYFHRIRINYTTLMERSALPEAIRDLCTNVKVAFRERRFHPYRSFTSLRRYPRTK